MSSEIITLKYPRLRNAFDLVLAILSVGVCSAILLSLPNLLFFVLIIVVIFLVASLYMVVRSIGRLHTSVIVDDHGITLRHLWSRHLAWSDIKSIKVKRFVGRKSLRGKKRVYETLSLMDANEKPMNIDQTLDHYRDLLSEIAKQTDLAALNMDGDTSDLLKEYEVL